MELRAEVSIAGLGDEEGGFAGKEGGREGFAHEDECNDLVLIRDFGGLGGGKITAVSPPRTIRR